MTKLAVDRRTLVPTVQAFQGSAAMDPDDLRVQAAWRQLKEESEADDLRKAIEEVRRAKAEDPENWQEKIKLREGVDFWRLGEEPRPSAAPPENDPPADPGDGARPGDDLAP